MKMKARLLVMATVICSLFVFAPFTVSAQEDEGESSGPTYLINSTHINPIYEDVISESELVRPRYNSDISSGGITYYDSVQKAADAIRPKLVNRETTVTVGIQTTSPGSIADNIFTTAYAHTGKGNEGDYILCNYGGYHSQTSYSSNLVSVTYTVTYYTSADQEQAVTSKLNEIMPKIVKSGMSKLEKVQGIYDYICSHVVYDNDHLNDSNYKLQYTAYAALIGGTSVCQGYANLFYRMCLDAGVDARIIIGDGGGPHGWNIVQLDNGRYYNVDSTWDTGKNPYQWFLLCNSSFKNHTRNKEYRTTAFNKAYPMATADYFSDPTGGSLPDTDSSDSRNVFLILMIFSGAGALSMWLITGRLSSGREAA